MIAPVAAVQRPVNVSSSTSSPIAGPDSRCTSASRSSGVRACRSTPESSVIPETSRTAASTSPAAACVAGRSTLGSSTNAPGGGGGGGGGAGGSGRRRGPPPYLDQHLVRCVGHERQRHGQRLDVR